MPTGGRKSATRHITLEARVHTSSTRRNIDRLQMHIFIGIMTLKCSHCLCQPIMSVRTCKRPVPCHRNNKIHWKLPLTHLSVTLEVEGVVSLPSLSSASSCLVVSMTLAQSTRFLSGSSESTRFTVLVNRVDDPVDASITTNGLVLRIDQDDLVVFVGRVLVDPVRVQDSQVRTTTAYTLLGSRFERSLVFKLVDTLVCWFS